MYFTLEPDYPSVDINGEEYAVLRMMGDASAACTPRSITAMPISASTHGFTTIRCVPNQCSCASLSITIAEGAG